MQEQSVYSCKKSCAGPIAALPLHPSTAEMPCNPACLLAGMYKELSSAPRAGLLWVEGNTSCCRRACGVSALTSAMAKLLQQCSLLQMAEVPCSEQGQAIAGGREDEKDVQTPEHICSSRTPNHNSSLWSMQ